MKAVHIILCILLWFAVRAQSAYLILKISDPKKKRCNLCAKNFLACQISVYLYFLVHNQFTGLYTSSMIPESGSCENSRKILKCT